VVFKARMRSVWWTKKEVYFFRKKGLFFLIGPFFAQVILDKSERKIEKNKIETKKGMEKLTTYQPFTSISTHKMQFEL